MIVKTGIEYGLDGVAVGDIGIQINLDHVEFQALKLLLQDPASFPSSAWQTKIIDQLSEKVNAYG